MSPIVSNVSGRTGGGAAAGKINGAVGNYNAHLAAYPELDWESLPAASLPRIWDWTGTLYHSDRAARLHGGIFPRGDAGQHRAVGLLPRSLELHRHWLFSPANRGWRNRFLDHAAQGQPIDFENAEGNLGWPTRCWIICRQTAGIALAAGSDRLHRVAHAGCRAGAFAGGLSILSEGIGKLEVDAATLDADLDANWEVLAEPIQTVMRRHGIEQPYEQLKALTRGQRVDRETLRAFIADLAIPEEARRRLLA